MRALLLVLALVATACSTRGWPHRDDPDRPFRYGGLQLDDRTKLMILERASLEVDNEDHGLVIDESIEDTRQVCLELGTQGAHDERCISLGALRAWVRAGAPIAAPGPGR